MNLLADIGNTRTKWAVTANGRIVQGPALMNKEISRTLLVKTWHGLAPPQRIAISCVSSELPAELVRSTALALWPDTEIIRVNSQAQAFGVTNAYREPEKLGVDRWLSLIAARQHYSLPVCIADCGTAITVDLIDEMGHHQGGMICPGLTLMKQSLSEQTEALPFNDARFQLGPANCTEAAIYSGVLSAAAGLIEHVYAAHAAKSLLVLTGGDAEMVSELLACRPVVDPDLVLKGLAIVLAGSQ